MANHRTFILGIDGATFDLLNPWIEQGHLPNFARVAAEGVCQPLISTIPPISPVAWASLVTGKNPGKHGIIDWYRFLPHSYDYVPLCGGDRHEPALWDFLSQAGKQVGVLNVPMTYPPEEVKGFMVSGIDSPPSALPFTYPKELAQELKTAVGSYIIDIYDDLTQIQDWQKALGQLDAMIESRRRSLFYLLKQYPWDFFMAVFVFTDRLQHAHWSTQDPQHPFYTQEKADKLGRKFLEYYQKMDAILGELLQEIGENTNLLIVSDHGFGPCYKGISLNQLLRQMALLKITPPLLPQKKELFSWLKKFPGMMKIKRNPFLQKIKRKIASDIIDWSKTKAFTSISAVGNIHINLKGLRPAGQVSMGREYEEVREAIIKELLALRDPQSGEAIFTEIFKKEEIYSGEYLTDTADLMCCSHKMNMEYLFVDNFSSYLESIGDTDIIMPLPRGMEASHRMEGILMAWGPDIARGKKLEPAQITDVAPTALHLLGQAVPQDMDGKVLVEIQSEDFTRRNPLRSQGTTSRKPKTSSPTSLYSEKDLEKIRERLKGMGYIT